MDPSASTGSFLSVLLWVSGSGILALVTAAVFNATINRQNAGTEEMQGIANKVRLGAMAFLRREYSVIAVFIAIVAIALYLFIDMGIAGRGGLPGFLPLTGGSFILGAICSILAGYAGMRTATSANVRTTEAARTGLGKALRIAFLSGATMGLSVVGLGVLGLGDDLAQARAVAQVEEIDAAVVAPRVDPAREADLLPDVLGPQLAAGMAPESGHGARSRRDKSRSPMSSGTPETEAVRCSRRYKVSS